VLFSIRKNITEDAKDWCVRHGCDPIPFNIVTALCALGIVTYSEVPKNCSAFPYIGNAIPSSHFWICRTCQKPVIVGGGIPNDELCEDCR